MLGKIHFPPHVGTWGRNQGSQIHFRAGGAIFVGFFKFFWRGVRLCAHEKMPKIFLARGAIMHTRKSAKYLLFLASALQGKKFGYYTWIHI